MTDASTPPPQPHQIPRDLLAKYFAKDPRLLHAFENLGQAVTQSQAGVADTSSALDLAEIVTLSPNDAFSNEHVLSSGDGTTVNASPGAMQIDVDKSVARVTGGGVTFQAPGKVTVTLPTRGTLLSDGDPPSFSGLVNAASDSAAAAAGVGIGGVYHNAGALRVRLT
jgi:hypothetical protein